MTKKKAYQPMKVVRLGNLDELTQERFDRSGHTTDEMNGHGHGHGHGYSHSSSHSHSHR